MGRVRGTPIAFALMLALATTGCAGSDGSGSAGGGGTAATDTTGSTGGGGTAATDTTGSTGGGGTSATGTTGSTSTPITVPDSPAPIADEWDQDEMLIVSIEVAVGERVEVDQGLLEVETERITLLIQSPVRGTVSDIRVKLNDMVARGETLMTIDAD